MFYDVIVIGLGAMGSSALFHCARRGLRTLGMERYSIPHTMGSSHGITRIIRLAYYEHPAYVPLLLRAYELWRELEKATNSDLLRTTGSIDAGPTDGPLFQGSLHSCKIFGLDHEILTPAALESRYPAYRLPPESMALFQPQGGFLRPEACITAHAKAAEAHGATIHPNERVLGWEPTQQGVRVRTDAGEYDTAKLIVTAGAWIVDLVPGFQELAIPERQVLAWFETRRPDYFDPSRFPVFNIAVPEGRFYGFPEFEAPGFKLGRYHHRNEATTAEGVDREVHHEDEALLREFAGRYFPDGSGRTLSTCVCMFTNSPDEHFIIDQHPSHKQVILCSACSGHGFKFASVVGEILADLAQNGDTRHDIALHRLSRFHFSPNAHR